MVAAHRLAQVFLSNLCPELRSSWGGEPQLAAQLSELYDKAQAAWPGLALGGEDFVAHLARHVQVAAPADTLAKLSTSDLYLAACCLAAVPGALATFESACLHSLPRRLAHMNLEPTMLQDLLQELRTRFFVAKSDESAKIATYAGRAPLTKWVRAAAVKLALNWIDKAELRKRVSVSDEGLLLDCLVNAGGVAGPRSPEVAYLQGAYLDYAQAALKAALSGLDSELRSLLELYYLKELRLEQIASFCGVHKATISRRLAAVREQLLQAVRRELKLRTGGSDSVVDSLLAQLQSQIELSLSSLLRSDASAPQRYPSES